MEAANWGYLLNTVSVETTLTQKSNNLQLETLILEDTLPKIVRSKPKAESSLKAIDGLRINFDMVVAGYSPPRTAPAWDNSERSVRLKTELQGLLADYLTTKESSSKGTIDVKVIRKKFTRWLHAVHAHSPGDVQVMLESLWVSINKVSFEKHNCMLHNHDSLTSIRQLNHDLYRHGVASLSTIK